MRRAKLQPVSTAIDAIEDYAIWPWALMLSVILSIATAISAFDGSRTRHGDSSRASHTPDALPAISSYHVPDEPTPNEATGAKWTGIYTGADANGLPVYRLPPVNVIASRKLDSTHAERWPARGRRLQRSLQSRLHKVRREFGRRT